MHKNTSDKHQSNQLLIEELLRYFEINTKDLTGEIALWQSVVMQAVIDSISKPKDIKAKIERAKTISWFSHKNEDFILVCSFAELSPDFIIQGLRKILKKNKKPYISRYNKKHRQLNKLSGNVSIEQKYKKAI
ncbi:MAG: hypothetical protein PQ612_01360 [Rickettsiales bacterium]|nr:hypothetical protein [Pseudomonadota bacterium]MDA0965435.1 hypothetical protein [Pseudomonadota bacterium]MDG4542760.1 hypothetical protein [Rickettsiales bacterium]MDG4544792.1 hypothetical protein [Rickettsiales bacterium]MDG4546914.1 hypothetical protein [Rickettsiales bacterium]